MFDTKIGRHIYKAVLPSFAKLSYHTLCYVRIFCKTKYGD